MKCIWTVVQRKSIFNSIQSKFPFAIRLAYLPTMDPNDISPFDHCIKSIVPESYILLFSVFVRNFNPCDFCSIIGKSYNITCFICQGKKVYLLTLVSAENFFFNHLFFFADWLQEAKITAISISDNNLTFFITYGLVFMLN